MISALLVLALVAVDDPGTANDRAKKILADDKYAFCHDDEYPLTTFEANWCPPVSPEPNPRCPAFHRACKAPRAELEFMHRYSMGRGDGDRGDSGGPGKLERKTPDRSPNADDFTFQMPELGGFAYALFWIVLGLGVAFLAYVIIKNATRHKPDEEQPAAPPPPLDGAPPPAGPSEQVIRDVNLLLEQARAAASAGDFNSAIRHTHAALLHRLDHDGLIHVAPSRTNGDFVQDLKPKPELRAAVKDIVRDVEVVQFGTAHPDAGRFDRVFKRVLPIATRRGETLALLLGSALLSCTCQLPKSYPYDLSPSGTRAVLELAQAHGRTVRYRDQPLEQLDFAGDDRTLVLLHDAFVDEKSWAELLRWADAGNHLVLAGLTPPADYPLSVMTGSMGHALEVSPEQVGRYGDLELVTAEPTYLAGDLMKGEVLLARPSGEPYAVRYPRSYREGTVTILADDRLFTNGALMLADNPKFLARFLTDLPDHPIELVDGMIDVGADSPGETIENSHLTAAVLQALALLGLLFLWKGTRFGRPHDPPSRSRRHFTEHIEAVGQHYARARATRHAVRLYAGWALDRLRDRTLGTRQPGLYALAQAIAGRTGDDEARVMQILVEASSLRDDDSGSTTVPPRRASGAEDLQLMQALARLVRLVGGPR